MVTIYMARHARPDWNRKDLIYYQVPGPPLTEEGEREAEGLGYFFQRQGVRRVLASPLARCESTAQIAAGIAGSELDIIEHLAEWQPGEAVEAIRARFWPVFQQAADLSAREGPVALVTHGGPIAFLLSELGMDEPTLAEKRVFDHRNPLPTAGAWEAFRPGPLDPWRLRLAFTPEDGLGQEEET